MFIRSLYVLICNFRTFDDNYRMIKKILRSEKFSPALKKFRCHHYRLVYRYSEYNPSFLDAKVIIDIFVCYFI